MAAQSIGKTTEKNGIPSHTKAGAFNIRPVAQFRTGNQQPVEANLEQGSEAIEVMCSEISIKLRNMSESRKSAKQVRSAVDAIKLAREVLSDLPQQIQESQSELTARTVKQKAKLVSLQECIRLVPSIKMRYMQELYSRKEALLARKQKRLKAVEKLRDKLTRVVQHKESLLADPVRAAERQGLQLKVGEEAYKLRVYQGLTLFDTPPKNPGALKDGLWGHIAWSLGQPVSIQAQIQKSKAIASQANLKAQDGLDPKD